MSLPAVVNPRVAAMVAHAAEMERRAMILCEAAGDDPMARVTMAEPVEHRGCAVPMWQLYVQQAYGLHQRMRNRV